MRIRSGGTKLTSARAQRLEMEKVGVKILRPVSFRLIPAKAAIRISQEN
jgi:hypothetical protein